MRNTKKLNKELFIQKSENTHRCKYTYPYYLEYKNSKIKIPIICSIHGEFWQTPSKHLQGQGCPNCSNNKKLSLTEFIEKARHIHGNKYSYSEYKTLMVKIKILCNKCNSFFLQKPNDHITSKNGCPKCNGKLQLSKDEFIEKAQHIHGNKYSYSEVTYINNKTKVIILCNKCFENFEQTPNSHLRGRGCPKCKQSKLEEEIELFLIRCNIKYEREKKFKWLKRKRLDFYLFDYNIAIECQGKQHFINETYFLKNEEDKNIIKKRDLEKYNLCRENDIIILYYTNCSKKIIPNKYFNNIYLDKNNLLKEIKTWKKEI